MHSGDRATTNPSPQEAPRQRNNQNATVLNHATKITTEIRSPGNKLTTAAGGGEQQINHQPDHFPKLTTQTTNRSHSHHGEIFEEKRAQCYSPSKNQSRK
jgi:DNA anti-recombination protein RmuC